MKVKRENLLTIAGIVWSIAGVNILIIGITAYPSVFALEWWAICLVVLGMLVTLSVFHVMFGKLVKKHVARIRAFKDPRQNPLRFFDAKSYAIMAFMIATGVFLRVSGVVPDWVIAFFYTGLGASLALAGAGFFLHRFKGPGWSAHGQDRTLQGV